MSNLIITVSHQDCGCVKYSVVIIISLITHYAGTIKYNRSRQPVSQRICS